MLLTSQDAFTHQLRELYDAEVRTTSILGNLKSAVSVAALERFIRTEIVQSEKRGIRIADACMQIAILPTGEVAEATRAVAHEAEATLAKPSEPSVVDAASARVTAKLLHILIAAYESLLCIEGSLLSSELDARFQTNLNECRSANRRLQRLELEVLPETEAPLDVGQPA